MLHQSQRISYQIVDIRFTDIFLLSMRDCIPTLQYDSIDKGATFLKVSTIDTAYYTDVFNGIGAEIRSRINKIGVNVSKPGASAVKDVIY
ncbi:MAG TPA: hypothetical protein VN692_19830 [Steroidobacteraceae bacterium]|nr:hypothetical protein [Steroidobacteraceae bacterium]